MKVTKKYGMLSFHRFRLEAPVRGHYVLLLLFVATFLAYGNSLNSPFIWDDLYLIIANPKIDQPMALFFSPLWTGYTAYGSGIPIESYYRPLQALSYSLHYRLVGFRPSSWHVVNFTLHLLNAFFIYLLIKDLARSPRAGILGSLFFVVHPIFTTSVTFISGRADLFLLLFILVSFYMLMKFQEHGSLSYYVCSLAFFFAALLSKESAILLLLFLLLNAILHNIKNSRLKLSHWLCYLGMVVLYYMIRSHIVPITPLSNLGGRNLEVISSLWTALKMLSSYTLLFFLPLNPHLGRTFPKSTSLFEPLAMGSFLFLSFLLLLVYRTYRRDRTVSFGILWYLSWIIPLSIFNCTVVRLFLGEEVIMPENDLYVSSVGLIAVLGYLFDRLLQKRQVNRIVAALLIGYAGFLFLGTVHSNALWADDISFYEKNLTWVTNPAYTHSLHDLLGLAYQREGALDKAIRHFILALNIRKNPVVFNHLAYAYFTKNEMSKAGEQCLEAIRLDPFFVPPYIRLASVFSKGYRTKEAREALNNALQIHPMDERLKRIIENALSPKETRSP